MGAPIWIVKKGTTKKVGVCPTHKFFLGGGRVFSLRGSVGVCQDESRRQMVRSQLCATRFLCGLVPSLGCPSTPAHTCFCTRYTQKEGKKWGVVLDSAHRRAGCRGVDLVVERGGWVHCAQSTPGMSSSATRTTPAIASPHLLHAFALRGRKTFVLRICLWWAMGHTLLVCARLIE